METEDRQGMTMAEAKAAFLAQVEATQVNEIVGIPILKETSANLVALNTLYQM